jgi:putative transposase
MSGLSNAWRMGETRRLKPPATHRDTPHRFPAELIRPAVGRYVRCCRSSRAIAARRCARGGLVTYEALRQWCVTVGQPSATPRRRRRPQSGDPWPLDEVCRTIHGQRHSLGRAVEQDGTGLEILGPRRRDHTAATPCLRKRLQGGRDVPRGIVPDRRQSAGAAQRERLPGVDHRQHR